MVVPPRRGNDSSGTAAALVAVPMLLLGLLPSGPAASARSATESEKTPVSIQLFRYHFAGEGAFLAGLQAAYQREHGRPVELWEGEWPESPRKIQDWTGKLSRYAPDMMVVQDAQLPLVLGHAASLEARFPSGFLKALFPGALAQGRVQGVLTGLPWMVHPLALYYNADLLAAKGLSPPGTPEELVEVATKLSDPPNVYGFGVPGAPSGGAADCFMAFFRGFGGLLFDDRGRLSIDSDPGRRALHLLSSFSQSRATEPEVLTWSGAELAQLFAAGRVAMVLDGPWLLREAGASAPPFKVGVAPVPREAGGTEHLTTDCVIIFDTARDIDGCVHFLQYALGQDVQRRLAGLGVPSARRDAGGALPPGEGWDVYARALRDGRGPSAATWAEIVPIVERLIYATVSGRAAPQEAMDSIDIDLIDDPEYVRLGLPPPKPEETGHPGEKPEG
jgi:ABC-type glycerol-3-phosphate transport system substrate-binding protein